METQELVIFDEFQELFFTFQIDAIIQKAERIIEAGASPDEFLAVCQQCMNTVGKRFEEGEYYLPELVVTGDIFKKLSAIIKPHLVKDCAGQSSGSIVVGTPKGDIHSLGKDIFCTLLEAAGFNVHNLGEDVPPEAFIKKVNETGAQVVGMSSLLTTTYQSMQQVILLLEEHGLRERVKVVIGGGATTKELAEKIGADAQTWDAYEGVRIVQSFLS
jgi:methylmalonyl-CoA mutase cobalamin-binding domain/chain